MNFSLRVEQTLQQGFHNDEADAIPEFPDMGTTLSESGESSANTQENLLINGGGEEEEEEEEEEGMS